MHSAFLRILCVLCLALPFQAGQPGRLLDPFDDIRAWTAAPSDGVALALSPVPGHQGGALRMTLDFKGGAGYAAMRRPLPLRLPANYEISFWLRGDCPPNTLEAGGRQRRERLVGAEAGLPVPFPLDPDGVQEAPRRIRLGTGRRRRAGPDRRPGTGGHRRQRRPRLGRDRRPLDPGTARDDRRSAPGCQRLGGAARASARPRPRWPGRQRLALRRGPRLVPAGLPGPAGTGRAGAALGPG